LLGVSDPEKRVRGGGERKGKKRARQGGKWEGKSSTTKESRKGTSLVAETASEKKWGDKDRIQRHRKNFKKGGNAILFGDLEGANYEPRRGGNLPEFRAGESRKLCAPVGGGRKKKRFENSRRKRAVVRCSTNECYERRRS